MKALLAALILAVSVAAGAHNFHAGLTEISFNAHTGSTELVHTYMAHDIEALLTNLYQRQIDLSQPEDEAMLRKYIEKQFYLLGADGKRLPINWVGIKLDAETVVVFRELEKTPLGAVARIHDAVLSDFLRDELNTLNVRTPGNVRTLTFTSENVEQAAP
jgi:hypothetical protein